MDGEGDLLGEEVLEEDVVANLSCFFLFSCFSLFRFTTSLPLPSGMQVWT